MNFRTLFAAIATASVALALPMLERSTQDVWAPPFTFPTAGAQLVVGNTYKFTWSEKSNLQIRSVLTKL